MQMDRLYPPGRVWWATRDDSCTLPPLQTPTPNASCDTAENVRLYEVLDVEKIFGQVIFARDMLRCALTCGSQDQADSILSSHMPHAYDRVLQQLYPHSQAIPGANT